MALFTGAVSETQGVVQQIANVAVYQDKQADLLHTSPSYGTLEPAGEPGRIEARSLSFGYPGSAAVCNGVDLQVSPGRRWRCSARRELENPPCCTSCWD